RHSFFHAPFRLPSHLAAYQRSVGYGLRDVPTATRNDGMGNGLS
ncbi:MAG: hypothetical protein QG650_386, partial [Patescibacteria group bacterium]|nr:hypothetical protein [Patescibacteria group bacterium]